ncbi:MAG: LTA synthase family protein [Eubacterium sp.]|nr:LTA synthase family protein [Eubacterium sp.]
MRAFFNEHKNIRIVIRLLLALVIAALFVFIMDFDLLKSVYELYYGDSEIAQFFEDNGQNVFELSVKVASFKLVLYRAFYSMLPIAITLFLLFYYHSKKLPKKWMESDFFKKNDSMGTILQICRYAIGAGVAFLFINVGRTFFSSAFHNCILGNIPDYFRIIFACLAFMVFTFDWGRFIRDLRSFPRRHPRITIFLFMLFISIVSFCLLEFQVGSKTRVLVHLIHINIMYWLILQLALFVIFRRPKLGAILSLLFSFLIGLANDVVCQFRGNYIMFGDLTVVRTAMEVAGNYDYKPKFWFWLSLGLLIVMILFVVFIRLPKRPYISTECVSINSKIIENEGDSVVQEDSTEELHDEKSSKKKSIIKRIATTVIFEGLIFAFVIITMRTGDFYGKVFGVGWDYNDNVTVVGYLPYFLSNMDSTREIVVEGYSAARTQQIFDDFSDGLKAGNEDGKGEDVVKTEVKSPNIIIIQNEAFSDYSITADIETDQDYMQYIHSMKENTQKGYLNMSVTGGPTSNTEFEVLSRSTLQFFPYGSVPYTQYLKQNIPSVPEMLKNQKNPYYTVAYHSYYASGYNRNSVYDFMGFDRKEFEENFLSEYPDSELPRGYMTDEANYKNVIKFFEENQSSGQPFFCFNVTIQGHGGYTGGPYDMGESVKVTNFEPTDSINTYLSSVKLSDTAFKGLIEYFEKVNEPTIIFMYGDHQPAMDDEAKEILEKHPAWNDEMFQSLSQYYVPYVMWANFDIEEYDHLKPWGVKVQDCLDNPENSEWDVNYLNELSTNYVGSYVMNAAGVELSTYDKMLLDLHEEVPAITAIGVWDKDDNYFESAPASPFADRLKDLEIVQYNLIFDKKNKLTEYFLP